MTIQTVHVRAGQNIRDPRTRAGISDWSVLDQTARNSFIVARIPSAVGGSPDSFPRATEQQHVTEDELLNLPEVIARDRSLRLKRSLDDATAVWQPVNAQPENRVMLQTTDATGAVKTATMGVAELRAANPDLQLAVAPPGSAHEARRLAAATGAKIIAQQVVPNASMPVILGTEHSAETAVREPIDAVMGAVANLRDTFNVEPPWLGKQPLELVLDDPDLPNNAGFAGPVPRLHFGRRESPTGEPLRPLWKLNDVMGHELTHSLFSEKAVLTPFSDAHVTPDALLQQNATNEGIADITAAITSRTYAPADDAESASLVRNIQNATYGEQHLTTSLDDYREQLARAGGEEAGFTRYTASGVVSHTFYRAARDLTWNQAAALHGGTLRKLMAATDEPLSFASWASALKQSADEIGGNVPEHVATALLRAGLA